MRHAHQTLPWFLALTLCSLSACSDLFKVPACEFSMDSPLCSNTADPGTGQNMGGSMADGSSGAPDMTPRPSMKGPVSFSFSFAKAIGKAGSGANLMYNNWVGIHPPKTVIFASQTSGRPGADFHYHTADFTKKDLVLAFCSECPTQAKDVNLGQDIIRASETMFFLIRPTAAYSLNNDGSRSPQINDGNNPLLSVVPIDASFKGFSPLAGIDFNFIAYQKAIGAESATEISYYNSAGTAQRITFVNDNRLPMLTYYYAIGSLNAKSKDFADNRVLIFKDTLLAGAYKFDTLPNSSIDQQLTDEINEKVLSVSSTGGYPVRSAFIADFNQDGYMDMIYARHNNIFITSYNPDAPTGSRFTNWLMPKPSLPINDIDHTQSISVADLNGDGYPDLALEVVMSDLKTMVYFYLNNKS